MSSVQERVARNERAFAESKSPAMLEKERQERGMARLDKELRQAQQHTPAPAPTPEQLEALSAPVLVGAVTAQATLSGLYAPDGRLERVVCDLAGYTDPVRVEIWYRTNNRFGVMNKQSLIVTNPLSGPVIADIERVQTALADAAPLVQAALENGDRTEEAERLTAELEALNAAYKQLNAQLAEAQRAEMLDYYGWVCQFVRRISWNLDLPVPDCNKPETMATLFDETNDLARWIAADGYRRAREQAIGPNS